MTPTCQFNFDILGDEQNPPLLLLHGFLSSKEHWDLNLDALSQKLRLIRAELPGHGITSRHIPADQLTVPALIDGLEAVRKQVGVAEWFICGQSFGAAVTLNYALAHPDRVTAQAFLNANGALSLPADKQAMYKRAQAIRAGGHEEIRRQPFHPRFAKRFPPDIRQTLCNAADNCDVQTIANLVEHTMPSLSVRDRLAHIAVPTLLINGQRERKFQPHRDWAVTALPSLSVTDLDGGHAINIEDPQGFNSALVGFVERHI